MVSILSSEYEGNVKDRSLNGKDWHLMQHALTALTTTNCNH